MANKKFLITVRGNASFPLDMLRYDRCYPTDSESACLIGVTARDREGYTKLRDIHLTCIGTPTPERWESFDWRVIKINGKEQGI